jgi:ribosomal protein S24E
LNVAGNYISVLKVSDTTESTTKDTGCAIFEGGIGVEKNIVSGSYFKSTKGRWPTGHYESTSITESAVFSALNNVIPNVNDEIIISGCRTYYSVTESSAFISIYDRAMRYSTTEIRLYRLTIQMDGSTGSVGHDSMNSTGGSTIGNMYISW